jgi:glyoxylase-like metal-dependent hydrolase (beta-lactamase superfamily II)
MKRAAALLFVAALTFSAPAQTTPEPLDPAWCHDLPRPEYKKLERVPTTQAWFDVYRIRPGVFAIYEPRQFEEVISYLIVGEKRALLFDSGIGVGNIRSVVTSLTALPVWVLNSHTHFDHVGGNADFAEILGVDSAYTRHNAAGGTNDYAVSDALIPERLCGPLPAGVTATAYRIRPWKTARFVHDGEMLDLGGRELEVLFTPGHTPDSLSLFDRTHGLLFTGDTFYAGPIYLFTPETDFAAYTRSVERLAKLAPRLELVLPAHNVPVAEPATLLRLRDAVRAIHSGHVKPEPTEGRYEYRFQGFSLLLSPPPTE